MQDHREAASFTQWIGMLLDEARSAEVSLESLSLTEFIITNRLGASIMRDIILHIHLRAQRDRRRNGDRRTQGDNMLNEIETNNLPSAPEMRPQLLNAQPAYDSLPPPEQGQASWTSWDTCMNDFEFYAIDGDQQLLFLLRCFG